MGRKRYSGKSKNRDGKQRRKSFVVLPAVLLSAVLFAVIFGLFGYSRFLGGIRRVEPSENSGIRLTDEAPEAGMIDGDESGEHTVPGPAEDILNIMLIGQSARAGEQYHMADSMILVTVNKSTMTLTLTSFLRDAYLRLPDYRDQSGNDHAGDYQRLNVSYHKGHIYGGTADAMGLLNRCIYENFGVEVDHNIEVDFQGAVNIVDCLGGVEVELTQAEADYLNADDLYVYYDVHEGLTHLDGMATLSYVRMRNAEGDAGSDIRRTQRQRLVLTKLIDKAKQMDAAQLNRAVNEFLSYVVTDMTDGDITQCILEILPIVSRLKVETGTCPVAGSYWGEIINAGGYDASVLRYDEEQNRQAMMALTEGIG